TAPRPRGVFVTGTAPEVGKTVVSALRCARYRREVPLAYWKPIASGAVEGRDVETVAELSGVETVDEHVLLRDPLSPHLAARLEGRTIDPDAVVADFRRHSAGDRALIVEGAGGVYVPLTDDGAMLLDLLPRLGLPAVVVSRSALGTINHTLLTLEALRARGVEVAGVVFTGAANPENSEAIRRFGQVEILGHLPILDPLDRTALEDWSRRFDLGGQLLPWLT
ncbi:MAG: dethiobiotin synthase, partial [Acidobacteriota bacterium]